MSSLDQLVNEAHCSIFFSLTPLSPTKICTHLYLWSGVHRLLVRGDDSNVEQSRKDKDQTGSSGGS